VKRPKGTKHTRGYALAELTGPSGAANCTKLQCQLLAAVLQRLPSAYLRR
jgi:hypothetical protein